MNNHEVKYALFSFRVTDLEPGSELELRLPIAQRPERILGFLTHGEFRENVWLEKLFVGAQQQNFYPAAFEHICHRPLPASPNTTPQSQLWRGELADVAPASPGMLSKLIIRNAGKTPISGTLSIEMSTVL